MLGHVQMAVHHRSICLADVLVANLTCVGGGIIVARTTYSAELALEGRLVAKQHGHIAETFDLARKFLQEISSKIDKWTEAALQISPSDAVKKMLFPILLLTIQSR